MNEALRKWVRTQDDRDALTKALGEAAYLRELADHLPASVTDIDRSWLRAGAASLEHLVETIRRERPPRAVEPIHPTGLARAEGQAWCQEAGTPREHYDIALSKRALAVRYGAVEVGMHAVARIIGNKRRALQT